MQRYALPLRDDLELLTPAAIEFCAARLEAGAYSKPDSWPAEPTIAHANITSGEACGYDDIVYNYPDGMDQSSWLDARAAAARRVRSFECLWLTHNNPELLEYVSCSQPLPRLQHLPPVPARPSLGSVTAEILHEDPMAPLMWIALFAVLLAGGVESVAGRAMGLAAGVGFFISIILVVFSLIFRAELRVHVRKLREREEVDDQNHVEHARVEREIAATLSGWAPPNSGLQQTPFALSLGRRS